MSALMDLDVDEGVLEELDFTITCQLRRGCGREATLMVRCRSCGNSIPACSHCLSAARKKCADQKVTWVGCCVCLHKKFAFDDLMEMIPL